MDRLAEELLREIRARFQTDLLVFFVSHPQLLEKLFDASDPETVLIEENTWLSPSSGFSGPAAQGKPARPLVFSNGTAASTADCAGASAFPFDSGRARSGVIVPVAWKELFFGALMLGSRDPDRYSPEDGTDLLEQLGANIALSIENCLTYDKVREFSIKDPLTGLMNFFQIHTVLDQEFRKARRSGDPLSVLVFDLDFVQEVKEDSESGGEVLQHAAALLGEKLPRKHCFLGRYGSAEFLAVLPDVSEEEAREVAPYLAGVIRKAPFKFGNTAVLITATTGVGALCDETECAQDLVDAACFEICRQKLKEL